MKRFVLSLIMMSMFESIVFAQTSISIIPKPVKLQRLQGYFKIHPETVIAADENVRELAIELGQLIEPALGYTLMVKEGNHTGSNYIQLKLQSNLTSLGTEGYQLTATPQRILIEAPKKAGLFYGIQTFRQLLPPAIFSRKKGMGIQWQIPCVEITDYPRFRWRGMHLDVARHFMPKEFVKKYIDLLALHKMNTFHWHLTEDQGWRIEIKQYPRLTEVGAWRNETVIGRNSGTYDGKRYGGFYTQDDIREIVAYAKKRYITIVPEIEMPGHCLAALAAYPELSCTSAPLR